MLHAGFPAGNRAFAAFFASACEATFLLRVAKFNAGSLIGPAH